MRIPSAPVFAAVLALSSFIASAASAAPMKELEVYKGAVGKFACNAKELRSGKTFKAMVQTTAELDGLTFVERYAEVKSADHPNAWKGIFIMSYDPATKRWVRNGVDNSGERNAASSTGWNGDQWVWENDGANIVVTKAKGGFTFAVDLKEGGGTKRVVEAKCVKAA